MSNTIVLIVAAGRGRRAGGDIPKQYLRLGGEYVLGRTIRSFMDHPFIDRIATVIHPDDIELYIAATMVFGDKLLPPIHGGSTRQKSVYNGLKALEPDAPENILIHDAARPFTDHDLIDRVINGLSSDGAVLPASPVTDTIKQVKNHAVCRTIERRHLYGAQTPQGFKFSLILDLHKRARRAENTEFTDDASLAEWAGLTVRIVEGGLDNQKLTTRRDMEMAELFITKHSGAKMETRTGLGFDVHRFEPGDGTILCGIKIPYDKKLKGHSDADVAMHALTDAILGAIGAGDIGTHFPPSDNKWKGVASSLFLEHAVGLVQQSGGRIFNIDLTIICEQPKITPHREKMRREIARIMGLDAHRISIKATTTEGLGYTGRYEGIAAQAVATVSLPEKNDV